MAGHSKWANIQHRKNAQDARRGKLFTKLIREITVSARAGGPDPGSNPRLRTAMDKALTANMTRDTIERAIKRGSGDADGAHFEQIRYEGYGPGGAAVIVDCLTDNRNRTVSEVRHAFTKMGGNLGTDGSVAYMFKKTGIISFAPGANEDAVMEAALEAGADDVVSYDDGAVDVVCAPEQFDAVRAALDVAGLAFAEAEVTFKAENASPLDLETAQKMLRMIDMLEDLDDVQDVYTNADYPDEALGGAG
ncbi:MAG: YebC/PmpR family DNA-binding transcriptional regulator [Thiotrichales bacterium]